MAEAVRANQIERLQQRLEAWRESRRPRSRIPEGLWRAAAELARSYGVNKVARALHLDYYNLKERRDGLMVSSAAAGKGESASPFIEVISERAPQGAECVIELESARGAKMRIHYRGQAVPEAPALCAEFLKNGR
jgi:hypothetical protein